LTCYSLPAKENTMEPIVKECILTIFVTLTVSAILALTFLV
jgi:hypothetical protein